LKTSSVENGGFEIMFEKQFFLQNRMLAGPCRKNTWNIHPSNEIALEHSTVEFAYGISFDILITPKIIQTDSDLKRLKPLIRNCYFDDERKLKYFKIYSLSSCQLECQSFIFFNHCNCIPFFLPRNDHMKVCGIKGMECLVGLYNIDLDDYKHFFSEFGVCDCLETCNSITYSYELLYSRYDEKHSAE
jgi:hypothetical protein